MSTDKSIKAPDAPIKMDAIKMRVRFKSWYPAYNRLSEEDITAPWIWNKSVNSEPSRQVTKIPKKVPDTALIHLRSNP